MRRVVVHQFGGVDRLQIESGITPMPGPGQVLVRLTSVGLNHADLMGRRGEYRLSTGEPPFTPGLEGGGIVEATGDGVDTHHVGDHVTLSPDAPRLKGASLDGTYRTHFLVPTHQALIAPRVVREDQLGTLWLPYLTAWGCLVWKQKLTQGAVVLLPAASSSVALAAAQIVKHAGGQTIALTTREAKVERIRRVAGKAYDHLLVTHDDAGQMRPWHREVKAITEGRGVNVSFDPVASGAYLSTEVRCLADDGVIWVYGLLGGDGPVDVTPLIRKRGAIRGWGLSELIAAGRGAWEPGCRSIFEGFESGAFSQHIDQSYRLTEVQEAHREMERGQHVGKLVLLP